jgi:MFS family permease
MSGSAVADRPQKTPSYAWVIVIVTYIASFMAPMQQMKVPPVADYLIPTFGMDGAMFGLLMSSLSIVGVILAFPAVFIVRKIGLKATTLLAVGCLAVGCFISVLFMSLPMLFLGRIIEGVGIGLVGISAPAGITIWFPREKRGLPLGIWATWFPLGIVLMLGVSPSIAASFGWQSIWWICGFLCVAAFILFAIFFKLPSADSENEVTIQETPLECLKILKTKYIWFMGVTFFCYNFIFLGIINSFYNQYLMGPVALDPVAASGIVSMQTLIGLFLTPVIGFLSDKTGRRRAFIIVGLFMVLAGTVFAWLGGVLLFVWLFICIAGLGNAVFMGAERPLATELLPAGALGATMSMVVLQFFQNLGATVGAPLFGSLLDSFGWMTAGLTTMVPAVIVGLAFAFLIKAK